MALLDDRTEQDVLIVKITVECLDSSVSKTLINEMEIFILEAEHPRIILDLSPVHYIDSSGIGAIIASLNKITQQKGRFVLCGLKEPVLRVFKLTRLLTIFKIYENQEDALAALLETP